MTGESKRQIEHILPLVFAFLLRYLTVTQAVVCCLAAALYGLFLSPRVVPDGVRPEETRLGFSPGKLYYAFSILALLLIFHDRIHVAAAAWAVLALGDSTSNLAGRAWGKKLLPWSRDKTWVGSLVFIFSSWAGSLILFYWTSAGGAVKIPEIHMVFLSCGAASAAAALVESLPLPLDDNITCPLAAGAVLGAML